MRCLCFLFLLGSVGSAYVIPLIRFHWIPPSSYTHPPNIRVLFPTSLKPGVQIQILRLPFGLYIIFTPGQRDSPTKFLSPDPFCVCTRFTHFPTKRRVKEERPANPRESEGDSNAILPPLLPGLPLIYAPPPHILAEATSHSNGRHSTIDPPDITFVSSAIS